jgi:hypothetical protein
VRKRKRKRAEYRSARSDSSSAAKAMWIPVVYVRAEARLPSQLQPVSLQTEDSLFKLKPGGWTNLEIRGLDEV